MLTEKDIRVGDWFRYRYTKKTTDKTVVLTFKITCIEYELGKYWVWGVDEKRKDLGRICKPEELKPIRLRKGFFNVQGYENRGWGNLGRKYGFEIEGHDIEVEEFNDDEWIIRHQNTSNGKDYPSEQIVFDLHELQHLMRKWQIEPEIDEQAGLE